MDLSKCASASGSVLGHNATHNTEESIMWECGICTLLNPVSISIIALMNLFNW